MRGLLNLHQGEMTMTEHHERWAAGKDLSEEFSYKIGEINQATDRECKAGGIASLDRDYVSKRTG